MMLFEEWQRWLDNQFLDSKAQEPEEETQETSADVNKTETSLLEEPSNAPIKQRELPQNTTAASPVTQEQKPADQINLADTIVVPSITNYLPKLNRYHEPAASNEKAAESAPPVIAKPAQSDKEKPAPITSSDSVQVIREVTDASLPQNEEIIQAHSASSTHAAEEIAHDEPLPTVELKEENSAQASIETADQIPSAIDETVKSSEKDAIETEPIITFPQEMSAINAAANTALTHTEEDKSAGIDTIVPEISETATPPAKRTRPVRGSRISDTSTKEEPVDMWSLVPRHLQVLIAMGSDEKIQSAYKRPLKESRIEFLEKILDPTLSLEDVARLLNVCPTTVRRYTNKGLLEHQRTAGDQRRFKLSDVLSFMESQSRQKVDTKRQVIK
jgi:excisionase family DNA binding protein